MTEPKRYTLHDVAEQAGVSYQTVSRVINNHPYVAQATRERVMNTIRTLDYRPNRAAQSLAGHRSQTFGMITSGMSHYGPAQMAIHIERAARNAGYDIIFADGGTSSLDSLENALHHVRRWDVDGLLLITPLIDVSYEGLKTLCGATPLVQIGAPPQPGIPAIAVDQALGSILITRHLIELGHTQIAEISGPLDWFDAKARHESWLNTLRQYQLQPVASIEGNWTARSGYEAARRLLSGNDPFTALVVGNDQMALGAVRALRESGLRVPDDVSVVGFDDIPEAAYFEPPLTTVRQDFAELAQRSVEYLVECVAQPELPLQQNILPPTVVIRESTAPIQAT